MAQVRAETPCVCGSVGCPGAPRFKGICSMAKVAKVTMVEHSIPEFDAKIVGSAEGVRAYRASVAAKDEDLMARAKQIHDLNSRLTFAPSAQERIDHLTAMVAQEHERREAQEKRHTAEVLGLTDKLVQARGEATDLREQVAELQAEFDAEPSTVCVETETEQLTEVIRNLKRMRRRWRGDE